MCIIVDKDSAAKVDQLKQAKTTLTGYSLKWQDRDNQVHSFFYRNTIWEEGLNSTIDRWTDPPAQQGFHFCFSKEKLQELLAKTSQMSNYWKPVLIACTVNPEDMLCIGLVDGLPNNEPCFTTTKAYWDGTIITK